MIDEFQSEIGLLILPLDKIYLTIAPSSDLLHNVIIESRVIYFEKV